MKFSWKLEESNKSNVYYVLAQKNREKAEK